MAEPTGQQPALRRERLLSSTLELFAQRGYAATTVADIESAAGLSPGSGAMYRHFSSKEDLGVEVLTNLADRFRQFRSLVPQVLTAGDPHAELVAVSELFTGLWVENQGAFALMGDGQVLPDRLRAELGVVVEEGYGWFVDWLSVHLGSDFADLNTSAMLMAGSLSFYGQQFIAVGSLPLGIPQEVMFSAWVDHWTEFVFRHREML